MTQPLDAPATTDDDTLSAALARYGVAFPPEAVPRLDRYARLLWQANARLNLTRHTTYDKFVARDVVDSLALAELLGQG
jgi:16S rRNA (guanine527-N7)-methyltransferase